MKVSNFFKCSGHVKPLPKRNITDLKLREIAEKHLEAVREQVQKEAIRYSNDQERQCHRSLKTSRYESQKNRNPHRVDGTCMWVFTHPQYQAWLESSQNDLIWISADPGCGKSVLSKSLVDKDLVVGNQRLICYFFFKDNDEQNRVHIALCALLHQLFTHKQGLLRHAIPSWSRNGSKLQQDIEELWRVFLSAATDPAAGDIICVLDALDECEQHDRLSLIDRLKEFRDSATTRKSKLKFLLTSRPYENIHGQWYGIKEGISSIWLRGEEKNDDISREINLVIEAWVKKISEEKKLPQNVQDSLETTLKQMHHRTYLWLYLVIEEIRASLKRTPKAYDRILNTIPSTVEEAYEKILNNSVNKQETEYLLHIIVAASRPLTLREMDVAFSIATQEGCNSYAELDLDKENTETRIRNLCGLFVYVADSRIYLIHQTAKEFLVRTKAESPTTSNSWRHSIDESVSEMTMSRICIQYLLFTDFDRSSSSEDVDEKDEWEDISDDEYESTAAINAEYEFMGYATVNWPAHFREVRIDQRNPLVLSAQKLHDADTGRVEIWFPSYWKHENIFNYERLGFSSIHYAALCGHEAVVALLLQTGGVDPDSKDKRGRAPLSWAAKNGHEAVVVLLLQTSRVDPDSRDENSRTPLRWAAEGGHEAVAALLLQTGRVDPDSKDEYLGRTPLSWAAMQGHEAVVVLLLQAGVDLDSKDGDGRTPLSYAAKGGHKAVTVLLLQAGVDPYSKDKMGQTPMSLAKRYRRKGVIALMSKTRRRRQTSRLTHHLQVP